MGRELKPCGTYAAYRRHRRQGSEPCAACAAAWTAYNAQYSKKYRQKLDTNGGGE